jgi:hypothetical protein
MENNSVQTLEKPLRKLDELSYEEFMDVLLELSHILPIFLQTEMLQLVLFKQASKEISTVMGIGKAESAPAPEDAAHASIQALLRDIYSVLPQIAAKEKRGHLIKILHIWEGAEIEYNPITLIKRIKELLKCGVTTAFLELQGSSEQTER